MFVRVARLVSILRVLEADSVTYVKMEQLLLREFQFVIVSQLHIPHRHQRRRLLMSHLTFARIRLGMRRLAEVLQFHSVLHLEKQ